MATATLKPDATITDVMETLTKPDEYLRVVFGHLSRCRAAHGNASVRIGTTGKGKNPYHKIVYTDGEGGEALSGAFDHERPISEVRTQNNAWSTAALSFEQVSAMFAAIRNFKLPAPARRR